MPLYCTPWRAVTASCFTVYGMLKPVFACTCGDELLALVPIADALQHAPQRGLIGRLHAGGLVQIAQGVVQQALRSRSAHGFAADYFHHMLGQDAADHLHFRGVRRVV